MSLPVLGVALLLLLLQWGDARRSVHGAASLGPSPSPAPATDATAVPQPMPRQDLREALAAERLAEERARSAAERRDLDAFYDRRSGAPAWIDATGRLTPHARAGLAMLEQASADGLDPADYHVSDLLALATALSAPSLVPSLGAARFDVLITSGVLRYFRHLHLGRIDPRTLGHQLAIPADDHDFAEIVRRAIETNRLTETAEEFSPPLSQYRLLKTMLATYRALAAQPAAIPRFAGTVHPGDHFADLAPLHRLLASIGDLPGDTALPPSGLYDETIRAGVIRFQRRHGLETDGVIGRATQEALSVPLAWRVRQIELALERLRWLPDLTSGPLVAVNIPMFRLWAWNSLSTDDRPALSMAVIVGRALDTRTPVFADAMKHVIFRPYWNVPTSILRNDVLPTIRRDPTYLTREDFEIVRGQADDSPILAATAEHIAALGKGGVRLRQRPGSKNALGLIKFMFPNQNDVYMHATPAPHLFQRSRRDFSHGCIRIEDPVGLAEWVLGRDPSWTRETIQTAMNGASNRRVDLPEPIQVVIFYTTAVVMPEDRALHFASDLYGHDERLDKAL